MTGQANHVGTTPMALRKDALAAAAAIISGVERLGRRPRARSPRGQDLRRTEQQRRHPRPRRMHRRFLPPGRGDARGLVTSMRDLADDDGGQRGVDRASSDLEERARPVRGGDRRSRGRRVPASRASRAMRLWSGAGHDAMYMQRVCPTGMIFVRSAGGLSHSEAEYSTPEDLEAGANVLLHATLRLADRSKGRGTDPAAAPSPSYSSSPFTTDCRRMTISNIETPSPRGSQAADDRSSGWDEGTGG